MALADAAPPPQYPFKRTPEKDPWSAGQVLCERLGPQCSAVAIGGDGLVERVDYIFKREPGRTPEDAKRRILDMVRTLKAEFGLSAVPENWPVRADGRLRFAVRPPDGIGVVEGFLETRGEFGIDWHGSLWRRAVTGVDLGEARLVTREAVQRRLLGRHYCVREGTNEFEVQRRCRPCDPVAGLAESCANACEDSKVEKTRLVTRQVVKERPLRMHLQRVINGAGLERLLWTVSVPETPENLPPDLVVDAFTGEVSPPGALDGVTWTSPVDLDE
ncbi:MAG: hypothetical protein GYA21_15935 [Myxococcales bacterium]|nr:hypothetical protein [Myxococcales bacterium]